MLFIANLLIITNFVFYKINVPNANNSISKVFFTSRPLLVSTKKNQSLSFRYKYKI